MREQHLVARAKRRRTSTTRPGKGRWRAPDLIGRDFPAQRLNQKWYGDGTELPTDEGKLYLASVLDMGSRRVVGFAIGEHHDAELAYGALTMAVAVRGGCINDVIMHTDQGSEYTAGTFRAACTRLGVRQSMGRTGSALDNAVIESWHSTLTFELRALEHFATKDQARARVAAWIDEYNRAALGLPDALADRLRAHPARRRRAQREDRRVMTVNPLPHGAKIMAPPSPASRSSPPGGLRPALTPPPGGTQRHRSGAGPHGNVNKSRSHQPESLRNQGIATSASGEPTPEPTSCSSSRTSTSASSTPPPANYSAS